MEKSPITKNIEEVRAKMDAQRGKPFEDREARMDELRTTAAEKQPVQITGTSQLP
jgi:hypothetical protein